MRFTRGWREVAAFVALYELYETARSHVHPPAGPSFRHAETIIRLERHLGLYQERRLQHRAEVEGRADDTREAITERMHEYHKLTEAVLDHYARQGVALERIDGTGTPEQVFDRIRRAMPSPLAGEGARGPKGPGRMGPDAT